MKKIVNFRIEEKLLKKFKETLKKKGRDLSETLRNLIEKYIEENERR